MLACCADSAGVLLGHHACPGAVPGDAELAAQFDHLLISQIQQGHVDDRGLLLFEFDELFDENDLFGRACDGGEVAVDLHRRNQAMGFKADGLAEGYEQSLGADQRGGAAVLIDRDESG